MPKRSADNYPKGNNEGTSDSNNDQREVVLGHKALRFFYILFLCLLWPIQHPIGFPYVLANEAFLFLAGPARFSGKKVAKAQFVQYILNIMNGIDQNPSTLDEIEREVIELFVRMADVLNLPRSVGEIYGFLFISSDPRCLDDCRLRLHISKGSTSQGLKILRSFGAIRTVYIPGDRKDYYVAETSLRKIASGFTGEQVQPHVHSGKERIARIRALLEANDAENKEDLEIKVDLLDNWQKRAGRALPLILKLIGN